LAINGFDAIILDLDLPDISGIEVCGGLRATNNNTPIIMLTGRTAIEDKSTGLDCGADDYLTKPFSLKELSSRLNALVRRATSQYIKTFKVADIELDPINHTLTKAGQPVHMLPIDFALLEFFFRDPLQTFSKDALLARVWHSETEATDDAVRSSVKRLRKILDGSTDADASMIETYRRVGYRFVDDKMT